LSQSVTDISHAKHLVFIGFDGWASAYMDKSDMPFVQQMINNGSSSMDVTNVRPSTSWPNWSALFHGTPISNQTSDNFPSIITIIKDSNEQADIVFFHEWGSLENIYSNDDIKGFRIKSDIESANEIADYIKENKPLLSIIVFNEPDSICHRKGWGSKIYNDTMEMLDNLVGIIKQAVIDAGMYDNTVFVLSSDHGGFVKSHQLNVARNRKIPLVIYGKGIKNGFKIPFSAGIYDIAPTMAAILGLDIPVLWTGHSIFEIFE